MIEGRTIPEGTSISTLSRHHPRTRESVTPEQAKSSARQHNAEAARPARELPATAHPPELASTPVLPNSINSSSIIPHPQSHLQFTTPSSFILWNPFRKRY
ncbi:hypothetical protein K443DRAFT_685757 [Laccaria amethystina LaAM-08-1]|uniref:Uncharacterized protein n=1 Tax=Laccaria amethystina LaAM-08-1 TaxID=1095629 RepID=A0A0C9WTR3_9AGAR|nr:hypothetical protein K443DRAFT_685757 [Laccaria amethystina LaAM-08-1]